ncbi:hypothetical protein [Xanthomonas oryzae]|uniref:hypothetical protein n=1 Tax=Xanthomonas oryzae TaxID=347 RepID=UPI001A91AA51|nr:hypothetical protein [Xanthomonas oryzae]
MPTPHARVVVTQVLARRRERQTYRQIGDTLGLGQSTVARIVGRTSSNRQSALEPPRPANRYEHPTPEDMLYLDIKTLERFKHPGYRVTDRTKSSDGAGWEYVHVAVDDNSGATFSCILLHPVPSAPRMR